MSRTLEGLVALATCLALLALSASPGAATIATASAGGGSINFTPSTPFDLVPTGTAPCASAASASLDVTMTSATAGTATATLATSRLTPFGANTAFFLQLGGTPSVTISGGTMTVTGTLTGNLYPETSTGSCVPDLTAPKCGLVVVSSLTVSGSWSGTVTPPALSGTAVLSGSRTVTAFGCTSPYSALNGKTLTLSGLTFTF